MHGPKTAGAAARKHGTGLILLIIAINALNMIDRSLPFILAEAIKKDLRLSDAEIGLLGGLVFAVVYAVGGLPFGRFADRGHARAVMSGAVAFWSVMTALGGLTQNFLQLAAARLGVAAGEAACAPSAHSIIADHFPAERRGTMIALISLGVPIGSMTGLVLGGWLVDRMSWREAFLAIGLPGLILAALAWIFLPSAPPREGAHAHANFRDAIRLLGAIPTFRRTAVAASLYSFGAYAMLTFVPAFLMRSHAMSASQAGLWYGLLTGVAGLIGLPASGWLADRLSRRDVRWRLRIPAILMGLTAPFFLAAMLVDDGRLALAMLFFPQMLSVAYLGPTFSAVHAIVPAAMRATATAALLGLLTITGASLGPLLVGWLSDRLAPAYQEHSLAVALLTVPATMLLSSWWYLAASRTLPADLHDGAVPAVDEGLAPQAVQSNA